MSRLMNKIEKYKDEICMWEEIQTDDAELLLVAYGCTARSAQEAIKLLRAEGIKIGLFLKLFGPSQSFH